MRRWADCCPSGWLLSLSLMSVAATQMQMQLVHGGRPNWQMVRAIVLSCHIGFVVVMGGAQGALMMVDAACCSAEPTHFVSLFHVSARQLNIQLYRTHPRTTTSRYTYFAFSGTVPTQYDLRNSYCVSKVDTENASRKIARVGVQL